MQNYPQAKSTTIRKALDEAAEDETVKAVVLRVDSGGGSVTASDIILEATRRIEAKKPMIVSFGNIAASGGYYVACGSDFIFADKTTITGSIGVVTGKLATTDMWGKIGIQWKEYNRGKNAALFSSARVFDENEREIIMTLMRETYSVFKNHVTTARGDKLSKDIEEIAGGRVYTGEQGLKLGLVDKIGTLDDAITYAAKQAGISDYEIRVLPQTKNFLEILSEEMGGGQKEERRISFRLPTAGGLTGKTSLMKAVLPVLRNLDPQRMRAVCNMLTHLEIIRQERVALMMPEMIVEY
jgi:protease-4